MKKHLLAVAVGATFALPAAAQVTISGNIDVHAIKNVDVTTKAASSNTDATTKTSNTGSGSGAADASTTGWATSELIFSASEDLGGGLKATAVFSQDIRGGALGAQRDRYLDVAGSFGSIRMGRFNPSIAGLNSFSGAATTNGAGHLNDFTTGGTKLFGTAISGGNFERNSGIMQFTTPTFSGMKVAVGYGKNSSDISTTADRKDETKMQYITAEYKVGGLTVAAGLGDRKTKTTGVAGTTAKAWFTNGTHNTTGNQTTAANLAVGAAASAADFTIGHAIGVGALASTWGALAGVVTSAGVAADPASSGKHDFDWIGVSYDAGAATILASHSKRKSTSTDVGSAAVTLNDAKVTSFGVMVPMGATTLRASAYQGKDERGTGSADDMKLEGNQISATYDLSKRTYLYAVMGESDVKRDNSAGTAATRKEKSSALGLVHKF